MNAFSPAPNTQVWPLIGGVEPKENKQQSNGLSIGYLPLPPFLVLPVNQHIGVAAEPLVAVGDQVLKGQLIASSSGKISACLHAPTSGKVVAIEPRPVPHASGLDSLAIIIEPDQQDQWREQEPWPNWQQRSSEELLARLCESGIVGLGGAGFPTASKLSIDQQIHTLVVNGTECEPYITADDLIMRERAAQILAGVAIMAKLLQVKQVLIGIEDNKPEAIAAMRAALEHYQGPEAVIKTFPTKYPSGGEKQLIWILTGQEVPSGRLPADLGMVCVNVGTAAAVQQCIVDDHPLISRITTLTGQVLAQPRNYELLIGTPIVWLLAQLGVTQAERIIMGGPMMGEPLANPQSPVVKTCNCLLLPTQQELPLPPSASPCIRCGFCDDVCPASLLPQQLYYHARSRNLEGLAQQHLFDCIECGACAYVCPSSIPLVQYYRYGKGEIRQEQQQQAKSERAKVRFENRQARLAQESAEKEAKRKARAEAAAKAQAAKAAGDNSAIDQVIKAAQAKSAAAAATKAEGPDLEALKSAVEQAKNKLMMAEERLAKAEQEMPENAAAFRTARDKFAEKLAKAEANWQKAQQETKT